MSPGTGPSRDHAACALRTSSAIARHFVSSPARPPMVFAASASRRRSARPCGLDGVAATWGDLKRGYDINVMVEKDGDQFIAKEIEAKVDD